MVRIPFKRLFLIIKMYPPQVGYFRPESLGEALEFLEREEAKVLAGGQSLIPMLKLRVLRPKYLVDIGGLKELSYIKEGDTISIGATTRHFELASRRIRGLEILQEAASKVGDVQVRNVGTIGGSVCNADPAADYPAVLTALDATMKVRSKKGTREVKAHDFFKGPFSVDLNPGEVLEEIRIPRLEGYRQTYRKVVRRAGDFALAGLALAIKLDSGVVKDVRIAFTGVSQGPHRAKEAEKVLRDSKLTKDVIKRASEASTSGANPPSDSRGSSWYRLEVMKRLLQTSLEVMANES
ncbi:aerobic-type carbon monoxide dehydrogenase, middle subunit CoxM/CutM-like protein [Metallosphaera yellowstonensis MK1]|jgi:glyceraldehyde dehydrogenase medium subunit|uniref:Aerobic-type carbon monoxide dehydrogenase, middle subunit CoxM/CutM-like protein n=2 Tax=Metallosphaera TaxID=41980 RepID=H2C5R9_9CREN|nr:aerobic-type carbon monoxide dehydrogenase, middle subunit CoxM/CutM-like protein [Metallosphaera yellowstonensis MK1]